ncbi:MAG TPA: hypothetical protein VJZ91_11705 [Blastocatellia bacterium]|nr:hypothetical protein [Blastocatellia bacterium]
MRYSGLHLGTVAAQPATAVARPAITEPSKDENPSYNQVIRFTSVSGDGAKGN